MRAVAASVAAAALLLACGGPHQTETAPKPSPSAKERACSRYGIRMAPFMRRFDVALDAYAVQAKGAPDDISRADAARNLASFIDGEILGLDKITSADSQLDRSHTQLVAALEEVGRASEQLATAYVLADRPVKLRALARRDDGLGRWSRASRDIVTQCSERAVR